VIVDRPDRLWVADITYVAIAVGFAYVAVILDAWSRRVVGYAISRSIDARLTMAALKSAVERRKPPPGCMHHSDRGSQGGFKWSSQHLDGSCDEHSKAALGSFWAGALVLTRSTAGGRARGAAAILGSDCGGHGE
jgi:putative transposase